jgi:DNA-binding beta-propeller fold protein YncE
MTASEFPAEGPLTETPEPADEEPRRRKLLLLVLLLFLLVGLMLLAMWYLLFRQPIVPPLPLLPDSALPHYTSSVNDVPNPMGVATTSTGDRVYVSYSSTNSGVQIFDGSGQKVGDFESPGAGNHTPVYLAIDPLTQEVYVSDRAAGAIYIHDAAGKFRRQFKPASEIKGWQPLGLAFDAQGNLYVTDLSGDKMQVEVFDRQGKLVRTFAGGSGLSFPNGVTIDSAGNSWVTDSNNGRVLVFDPNGNQLSQIGRGVNDGKLGMPRGIVAAGDRIFVVDTTGQGVSAYRPLAGDGTPPDYIGFFGGPGVANGKFQFPNGIAADGRGRIYVVDSSNNRVQVWSY